MEDLVVVGERLPRAPRARRPGSQRAASTRRRRRLLIAAVGTIIVLAAVGSVLARPFHGVVPAGITIGTAAVGGLDDATARKRLAEVEQRVLARGLTLIAPGRERKLPLRRMRVRADIDGALADAHRAYGPIDRLRARLGFAPSRTIDLRFRWQDPALTRALRAFEAGIGKAAVAASVRIAPDGKLSIKPGHGGTTVSRDEVEAALRDLDGASSRLSVTLAPADPSVGVVAARTAVKRARLLLDTKHSLILRNRPYPLDRQVLVRALTFTERDDQIEVGLRRRPIENELERLFGSAETSPRDARFVLGDDGGLDIVPSVDGRQVDAEAVREALLENPGARNVEVPVVNQKPTWTTAEAEALKLTDEVSSFVSRYEPGEPRVENIKRAAAAIDGTILKPNGIFSLNDVLGQRTIEAGYVEAPEIADGVKRAAIGGGVSQVATAMFNAAFMAGLELDAHTPHAFYIDRYPMGREATVSWGGPELIFTNNWPAALAIFAQASDTEITIRMFSRMLDREVHYDTGTPHDFVEPTTKRILDTKLKLGEEDIIQHRGAQGFTVEYWREVYRAGKLMERNEWKTEYIPQNEIIHENPKPEPPPTSSSSTPEEPPPSTAPDGSTAPDQPPTSTTGATAARAPAGAR